MTCLVWYGPYTHVVVHHQGGLLSTSTLTLLWTLPSSLISCPISCPMSPTSLSSPCRLLLLCCWESIQATVRLWDGRQLLIDHFVPFNRFLLWDQIVHFMNQPKPVFGRVGEYFLQTQHLVLRVLSAVRTMYRTCPHTLVSSWYIRWRLKPSSLK